MEQAGPALRSIELVLCRVEWCSLGDSSTSVAREATEIQVTQLADGAVAPGVEIPIHVVLPRLYTCPSVNGHSWGVSFELAITAIAGPPQTETTATVRMPITLARIKRGTAGVLPV